MCVKRNIKAETFQGIKLCGCFAVNFSDMRIYVNCNSNKINFIARENGFPTEFQSNTSCITIALNLFGFAIMSLFFIHSMALLVLTSRLFKRSWIVSATAVTVLSSANCANQSTARKICRS